MVVERPGFPPNPPVERVDFEADAQLVARLLEPGDHLVGHSYGGVVALLAAASRPEAIASLTVIEPPATRVASGIPDVEDFAEAGRLLYASGSTADPDIFLRRFLHAVGSEFDPPQPLPPELEQGARALAVERGPWEAESRWTRSPPRRSRSSSSRAATIPPSTRSATSSSESSTRSVWCCQVSAMPSSVTRSSTTDSPTSFGVPNPRRGESA